jgi:hypothetical protein
MPSRMPSKPKGKINVNVGPASVASAVMALAVAFIALWAYDLPSSSSSGGYKQSSKSSLADDAHVSASTHTRLCN